MAKQLWQADDGRYFESEAEADAHSAAVKAAEYYKEEIDNFIGDHVWPRGQETRARGILAQYLGWASSRAE